MEIFRKLLSKEYSNISMNKVFSNLTNDTMWSFILEIDGTRSQDE